MPNAACTRTANGPSSRHSPVLSSSPGCVTGGDEDCAGAVMVVEAAIEVAAAVAMVKREATVEDPVVVVIACWRQVGF